jgi:hypothetical protein
MVDLSRGIYSDTIATSNRIFLTSRSTEMQGRIGSARAALARSSSIWSSIFNLHFNLQQLVNEVFVFSETPGLMCMHVLRIHTSYF